MNAPVFPVPVWAIPTRSFPARPVGILLTWIGVGCSQPRASMEARNASDTPRSSKVRGSGDWSVFSSSTQLSQRGRAGVIAHRSDAACGRLRFGL